MVDDEPRLMLLVADDASQIRQINALAGRAGWRMRTVPDGETALRMLDDTSPDAKPDGVIVVKVLLDDVEESWAEQDISSSGWSRGLRVALRASARRHK